ncbi:hypothetical protein VJ923_05515 [Adlercreutzia sp. R25]|uniref:Uncharacterized protein n=1 Tax=Adlercreutzia shanghongiae TaxID=3111773 RepID=A0ABU6IXT3_9ACTN|nr:MULTISPECIES: hypothetical protein [unclassified Adlercreutzia]MEC4272614.1 hypothetical protein [Adlercreutzia sp. R25]MEC4294485.1 hypothetical protein [Adlercreutzia sp. R22]
MKDKKSKKIAADRKSAEAKRKSKRSGCKGVKHAKDCKGCKKSKAALQLNCCTCCKKHCPLSTPKCGKGRRLAAALRMREEKPRGNRS